MIDPDDTPTDAADGWSYVAACQCDRCVHHHMKACDRCVAGADALNSAVNRGDDDAYERAAEMFCDEGTHVEPGHEPWASEADLGNVEREAMPTTVAHYQGGAVEVPRVPRRVL